MKSIFYRVSRLEKLLIGETNQIRNKLFEAIKTYVYSGQYSSYRDTEKFLKYVDLDDITIAKKMGIKDTAVRQIRSRLSKEASRVVTEELLNTVEFGTDKQLKQAYNEFILLSQSSDIRVVFPTDIVDWIFELETEPSEFEVGDCKYELTLLHWLQSSRVRSLIADVDANRLGYLLRVLQGETGTNKDRVNILRVLTADDLQKKALPQDRAKFTFPPVRPDSEF